MSDDVRINGFEYSYSSISVTIAGERLSFTSISYADKLDTEQLYGNGQAFAPEGDTRGKYVPETVKLTGKARTIQSLRERLAAQSADGKSYGNVRFPIAVQYFEQESDADPIAVEILNCRLTGNTASIDQGPEGLMEEVEITTRRIKRNGLTLYTQADQ